jgi:SWI/SNF-related matrix-associated actin-dependent regulator of chromatin subfamily E protein 1
MDSSEAFNEELKKHCKKAVEEETFQKLVDKQYEILKKEFEEKEKNSPQPPPTPVPMKEEPHGKAFTKISLLRRD